MKYNNEEFNNMFVEYHKQLRIKKISRILDLNISSSPDKENLYKISGQIIDSILHYSNIYIDIERKNEILYHIMYTLTNNKNISNPFEYLIVRFKREISYMNSNQPSNSNTYFVHNI